MAKKIIQIPYNLTIVDPKTGKRELNEIEVDRFFKNLADEVNDIKDRWACLGRATTQKPSSIADVTATGNGNLSDLGLPAATEHGVCWDTNSGPTVSDSKTTEGAPAATGAFTSNMTGLSASTTYYVRTYVTNAHGTHYGNEVSFTTTA